MFERITIIGMGLIGSSIARAAHAHGVAKTIVGYDHNEVSLAYARKHDFITFGTSELDKAVEGSNLVILATPPSTLGDIATAIAPHLSNGAIVMDVCSVKEAAIAAIAPHMPEGVYFIPAHPIAGSEQSGVASGRSDLFEKKRIVVTPEKPDENLPLQNVFSFWKALGARCEAMPPQMHDMVYAYVSHLPQLLAFAAGMSLEDAPADDELLQKFLRLSDSNPDLWIDIFIMNKAPLLKALDRYLDVINHVIGEFAQAPGDATETDADKASARSALFPRIAASCLITTVMEAEKVAGFSFARYAGTGFADFTYPASQPPEGDIESISNQYTEVGVVLAEYKQRLAAFRHAIATDEGSIFAE